MGISSPGHAGASTRPTTSTQSATARHQPPRVSPRVALAAVIAGCVVVLSIWTADDPSLADSGRIVATAIALTAVGLIGTMLMTQGRPLRRELANLRLGPWMGVGFTVGYGVATLAWLNGDLSYRGLVTASTMSAGAVIAAAGFGFAVVGYLMTPNFMRVGASRLDARVRGAVPFQPPASRVVILFLVALLGHALRLGAGTVGFLSDPSAALTTTSSSGAILAVMTQMGLLATLTAAWRYAKVRSAGALILLAVIAVSQIGIGLFSGVKEAGILQLVAVVLGLSAFGRLKIRPVIGAVLVTLFVITPLVTAYRQVLIVGSSRLTASQVVGTVDLGGIISDAFGASDASTSAQPNGWGRWSRVGDVSIIVNQSPSPVAYIAPTELFAAPVLGLIPRSLWPDKPVLDAGYQINQIYYHSGPGTYSAAAATPYGDLFRHGGILVVVLGMVLFGGFIRLVDSRTTDGHRDPRLLFLPMLLFPAVVKQEIDYVGFTASILLTLVTYALAVWLTGARRRSRG